MRPLKEGAGGRMPGKHLVNVDFFNLTAQSHVEGWFLELTGLVLKKTGRTFVTATQ